MKPRVTMRDVANMAGVSQSTVSRVLSDTAYAARISQATRNRVLSAAEQLDYQPNLTARSMRGQWTYMIAVMIPDIVNPLFHAFVRTVQGIARQCNYDVLVANTDHVYDNEIHFCNAIMRRPVDGVLLIPVHLTHGDITSRLQNHVPIVALAGPQRYPDLDTFCIDDEVAVYNVVKWLIEIKGHTSIGFLGADLTFPPVRSRQRGYRRALDDAGLTIRPEHTHLDDYTIQGGQRAMRLLLEQEDPPTAVMCYNDLMALGAINMAQEMHYRVPEDIAIVGFDNIPEGAIFRPQLTTIEQNATEIGELMTNLLFERIQGTANEDRVVCEVKTHFIERQST